VRLKNPKLQIKTKLLPRPKWIRGKVSWDGDFNRTHDLIRELGLNSVCVEAACPNRSECWALRHVTFMILGDVCTRNCRFCNIAAGSGSVPDPAEARNIASAVKKLSIKYIVITSVTRDDLEDRGTGHFLETVREVKAAVPETTIELLIPDLDADPGSLREIAFSGAKVIGHNIEIPQPLYADVRPKADYRRSLDVLGILDGMKEEGADILVKSSIILGLGETENDVLRTLRELKDREVDIVYIGQYLSPSVDHWPVKRYYTPQEFKFLEEKARRMGFGAVRAGVMVRSSYRAFESYQNACQSG